MLLDGLASAFQPGSQLPSREDFAGWAGPGSLCRAAVRRQEAVEAAERARVAEEAAALVEQHFAAELAAQEEQAAEDWEAAFDEIVVEGGPGAGLEEPEEEWEAGFAAAEQLQWGEGKRRGGRAEEVVLQAGARQLRCFSSQPSAPPVFLRIFRANEL